MRINPDTFWTRQMAGYRSTFVAHMAAAMCSGAFYAEEPDFIEDRDPGDEQPAPDWYQMAMAAIDRDIKLQLSRQSRGE